MRTFDKKIWRDKHYKAYIKRLDIPNSRKYFGVTLNHPEWYVGSGTAWREYLLEYPRAKIITDVVYCTNYHNKLKTWCTNFSDRNDIVNRWRWLNKVRETGGSPDPDYIETWDYY